MINIFINRKRKQEEADRFFISWDFIFPYILLYFTISLLFFLNVLPTGYASFYAFQPSFLLIAVFYWSVFKPEVLPFSLVFALGVMFDLLMGFPMGITAVLLLSVQYISRMQRRFLQGQSFMVLWLSFTLMCSACFLIQWIVFSLFFWQWMLFIPVIVNAILTILLFPFLVAIFHKLRRSITKVTR